MFSPSFFVFLFCFCSVKHSSFKFFIFLNVCLYTSKTTRSNYSITVTASLSCGLFVRQGDDWWQPLCHAVPHLQREPGQVSVQLCLLEHQRLVLPNGLLWSVARAPFLSSNKSSVVNVFCHRFWAASAHENQSKNSNLSSCTQELMYTHLFVSILVFTRTWFSPVYTQRQPGLGGRSVNWHYLSYLL